MQGLFKLFLLSFAVFCLSNCANMTYQEEVYNVNKTEFFNEINSYIGKTPNELYAKYGKPDEYTTDVSKNKEIKGGHIIYEKVFNFNLQQYDCVLKFNTDKTQKLIKSVEYSSEECFYLAHYNIGFQLANNEIEIK